RAIGPWWIRPGFAIGFVGAYTTFSTFSYETLSLMQAGSLVAAGANIVSSVGGALAGVFLGSLLVRAL
ncbi:MAG: fluoride efflux transporter FluC, partial [Candidatus Limnocylindrales bacterium]